MLRAEAVADRNAHVFEGDLRIFEAMHAEQFFRLAAYDAGAIRLDQDAADTAVPAPAGLIRQADAEHPEPGEIPIEFARETILAVDRRSGGQDLRLGKAAHRVA